MVIRANKSRTFFAKKAVPSCLVILGFNVTPSKKKKKRKRKRKKKKKKKKKFKPFENKLI